MSYDRVTSVNDTAVITTFVEHTHVYSEYVCKVDSTVCSALIRRDNHKMVSINSDILYVL